MGVLLSQGFNYLAQIALNSILSGSKPAPQPIVN